MSRHEMDLEKAISHDQQKTKSLSILLTDAKSEDKTLQSEDPINHIKELLGKVERAESKFFKPQSQGSGESSESDAESEDSQAPTCFTYKEFLKKTKQELQDRPVVDVPPSECPDCKRSTEQCYYHSKQKGDQKDQALPDQERNIRESIPKLNVPGDGVKKNRKQRKKDRIISGMKHQTSAGVSSERVESIPVDVIKQYRISVDDIKQMERFADYSPGEPSKVLCLILKGLHICASYAFPADSRTCICRVVLRVTQRTRAGLPFCTPNGSLFLTDFVSEEPFRKGHGKRPSLNIPEIRDFPGFRTTLQATFWADEGTGLRLIPR